MVSFSNAWKVVFFALVVLVHSAGRAEECPVRVGEYSGTVKAEWLTKTREMRLLEPFAFKDPNCKVWAVPKGAVVDGASIPQVFWSLIGGPFEGRYRDASVVHDYYCKVKTEPSDQVHEMFYYAMLANGVDSNKAGAMFYAVRWFGPNWRLLQGTTPTNQNPPADMDVLHLADYKVSELKYLKLSDKQLAVIASSSGQPLPVTAPEFTKFSTRTTGKYEPSKEWLKSTGKEIDLPKALAQSQGDKYSNAKQKVIDIPTLDKKSKIFLFSSYQSERPPTQSDLDNISAWIEREKPDLIKLKNTPPDQISGRSN